MANKIEFECPRCRREYELALDMDVVRAKRQRAKCARCGERFEIATRVDAFLARSAQDDVADDFSEDAPKTMADQQISAQQPRSHPAVDKHPGAAIEIGLGGSAMSAEDSDFAQEEDDTSLHQPFDWVAYAGADVTILHRELEAKEQDLVTLLSGPS